MIASDIVRKDDALNINTVQACLRSLIANHSIKVADIVYSGYGAYQKLCASHFP